MGPKKIRKLVLTDQPDHSGLVAIEVVHQSCIVIWGLAIVHCVSCLAGSVDLTDL